MRAQRDCLRGKICLREGAAAAAQMIREGG
ncbi:MAG: hypothetical protein ACJAVR_003443 [Paracoccaceae bacterium]|jgi:hypothetical protein